MNSNPPVSIFIVTYLSSEERCAILKRTCEAALAQNWPEFEVVVSDNGGDFSASDALASIEDPRLKVFLASENEGFTGNINRCVKLCQFDVIKLICDDDLIHPDFLKHTVPLVNDETLVVAGVEKFTIGRDPEAMSKPLDGGISHKVRAAGYSEDLWNLPYSASCIPSATLFSRKLFEELGGYDRKTVTSDWDFFIEACLHRRIAYVDQILCYVGQWPGSLTEEMEEKPFFFTVQGLYTKFRVFHSKKLADSDRDHLKALLSNEASVQRLRLIKNFGKKAYRDGGREYFKAFRSFRKNMPGSFSTRLID